MNRPRPLSNMQNWQVGPVPDYANVYNPTATQHPQNDLHQQQQQQPQHPYQPDMNRRDGHFPYSGHPPGMPQPHQQQQPQGHHPGPIQPPMNVAQPNSNAPPSQHATPTQTPTQSNRQRKRPAPSAAPPPVTTAASTAPGAVTPSQAHAQVPVPQGPPSAPPMQHPRPPPPTGAIPATAPAATAVSDENGALGSGGPPAKKSRTNTPWTPQEELRLKQMRDAGNSWAEIAKTFPTRTEGSVKKHWYKDMHYAEFAEDESQALMNAIKEYENNKWKVIGQKVGKPAKACEQYAKEHFPDIFGPVKGR